MVVETLPSGPTPSVSLYVGNFRHLIEPFALEQKYSTTTTTVEEDSAARLRGGEGG